MASQAVDSHQVCRREDWFPFHIVPVARHIYGGQELLSRAGQVTVALEGSLWGWGQLSRRLRLRAQTSRKLDGWATHFERLCSGMEQPAYLARLA
jgi:hypothetical protein